jgi:hypothetical protein
MKEDAPNQHNQDESPSALIPRGVSSSSSTQTNFSQGGVSVVRAWSVIGHWSCCVWAGSSILHNRYHTFVIIVAQHHNQI